MFGHFFIVFCCIHKYIQKRTFDAIGRIGLMYFFRNFNSNLFYGDDWRGSVCIFIGDFCAFRKRSVTKIRKCGWHLVDRSPPFSIGVKTFEFVCIKLRAIFFSKEKNEMKWKRKYNNSVTPKIVKKGKRIRGTNKNGYLIILYKIYTNICNCEQNIKQICFSFDSYSLLVFFLSFFISPYTLYLQ